MAKRAKRNMAEIQVINNGRQPEVKVVVPRGTTFNETLKLKGSIAEVVRGLTGCEPCNSGIPIWLVESDVVQQSVHVDLARLKSFPG